MSGYELSCCLSQIFLLIENIGVIHAARNLYKHMHILHLLFRVSVLIFLNKTIESCGFSDDNMVKWENKLYNKHPRILVARLSIFV